MVNKIILDYLQKYSGQYRLEDLKKKIIAKGYPKKEVDEAINLLRLKKREIKPSVNGHRFMYFGGIVGTFFLILSILLFITLFFVDLFGYNMLEIQKEPLNFAWGALYSLVIIFFFGLWEAFFYGFFNLGKKLESKLLKYSSFFIMVFLGAMCIFLVIGLIAVNLWPSYFLKPRGGVSVIATGAAINLGVDLLESNFYALGNVLRVLFLLSTFFMFVSMIVLFLSLIILGERIHYAKLAGIIGFFVVFFWIVLLLIFVLSSGKSPLLDSKNKLMIFLNGFFNILIILELLFSSLCLFDASKKFEIS